MVNNSFVELSSSTFDPDKTRADLVRVRLTRADISSGCVGRAVDQLMQLSDTPWGVLRWKDKLIIGFERAPGELRNASEIPEVVHYFRQLTNQWPFWSHFSEKDGGTMGAVLRLLIGTERLHRVGGQEDRLLTDADEVRLKSKWLFDQIRHLYHCHGLPEPQEIESAKAIAQAVNAMFLKN